MTSKVILGGTGDEDLVVGIERALSTASANAIGIASAFVSLAGVELTKQVLKRAKIGECRLIAGTDYAITHPEALSLAMELGWRVRIGRSNRGVFHPKLVVACQAFRSSGALRNPSSIYVGSANLTTGGLRHNVECGIVVNDVSYATEAGEAFAKLWQEADQLTSKWLKNYSSVFARTNRQRSVSVLRALGIVDGTPDAQQPTPKLRRSQPPKRAVVSNDYSAYVWAELRSFTGEYAFQVEFPRAAGQVLQRFVRGRLSSENRVDVECADGQVRQMTCRYYIDNSMYRINIPLSVPNVDWARENKQGVALVRRGSEGGAPISLKILLPSGELDEVVRRSIALGTWGKTSTRLYGWF